MEEESLAADKSWAAAAVKHDGDLHEERGREKRMMGICRREEEERDKLFLSFTISITLLVGLVLGKC